MRLYKIPNPEFFDGKPESAMDIHFASFRDDSSRFPLIVVGGRVAVSIHHDLRARIDNYLDQPWLQPNVTYDQRVELFEMWLSRLPELPNLEPPFEAGSMQTILFRPEDQPEAPLILGYIVGPLGPLPSAPPRPSYIYGHLPFGSRTLADTVVYRWEAYPNSRRITRTPTGGTIAADTYGAPASEVPFAHTGFSTVARFALPSLMPAYFRWELQPPAGTFIECGASVPLYGQSGGGVELRFPQVTQNRCHIADPVLLPVM